MHWSSLVNVGNDFQIMMALERAARFGGMVWQFETDDVSIWSFDSMEHDPEWHSFSLPMGEEGRFREDLPLRFRFYYRSIIFEVPPGHHWCSEGRIHAILPPQVLMAPRLPDERLAFPLDRSLLERTQMPGGEDMIGKIVDLSKTSMDLKIFGASKGHIHIGDPFTLIPLEGPEGFEIFQGKVCGHSVESIKYDCSLLRIGLAENLGARLEARLEQKGHLLVV